MRHLLLCVLLTLPALPAAAVECGAVSMDGLPFTVCRVDATTEPLRLFHTDPSGNLYGDFAALPGDVPFAMNAGMYHPNRRPVGLYIEDGVQTTPLITGASDGNFGLLPNGVFCIEDTSARVIETLAYAADPPACRDATQSGPMLVIDGALHPRFLVDATSRYIRNGVGTSADGTTAYFAISNLPVTFNQFGRLFRDVLGTPNALYFDGSVSRLHAPALERSDFGRTLGPIVAVTAGP